MNLSPRTALCGLLLLASALPAAALGNPCTLTTTTGSGYAGCTGLFTISPFVPSTIFVPHQGTPGTGIQPNVTVQFSSPYPSFVRFWANDPDFTGSYATFYIPGQPLGIQYNVVGDGVPGAFTVGGGGLGGNANNHFNKIVLHSASNDYLNWRVEYQSAAQLGTTSWCRVGAASVNCGGITATTTPWYTGGPFDPFQAAAGTGPQPPIDITFETAPYAVTATAIDPDFPGSALEAYAADGSLLGSVAFDGDNKPGFTTTSTKTISSPLGISRVRLVSAPADFVVFQGITATPFF